MWWLFAKLKRRRALRTERTLSFTLQATRAAAFNLQIAPAQTHTLSITRSLNFTQRIAGTL